MRAKNLILSAVVLLNVFTTSAQEAKSADFSLQAAIDYAYKNSPNYLNAQNDVLMARYKRKEVVGMALPQIGASVDMKNFMKIPTSVLPNFVSPAVYGGLVQAGVAPYDPVKSSRMDMNLLLQILEQRFKHKQGFPDRYWFLVRII